MVDSYSNLKQSSAPSIMGGGEKIFSFIPFSSLSVSFEKPDPQAKTKAPCN